MSHFDYIISGAGAAGLSLAYHFIQAGLEDKHILLLDRAPKQANDRTWCFWDVSPCAFDALIHHRWERVGVYGAQCALRASLHPYRYHMLRAADFYRFMDDWLARQPNITRRYEEVTGVGTLDGRGWVRTRADSYSADWVFNSIPLTPLVATPFHHHLLQHFLGWFIRAPRPCFDPQEATLMDFRLAQAATGARFVYVLPFDAQTALVEYTVFSAELLPQEAYAQALRAYLSQHLALHTFEIEHEEFGVIPMTDAPFPRSEGRVVHIGIAGGDAKPSTGYTFQRIQRRARQIARALRQGEPPLPDRSLRAARYGLYDSVLLNVLHLGRRRGDRVFCELFTRNPVARVLRFLDEDATLCEELQVMSSTHLPTFVAATLDVLSRRICARLAQQEGKKRSSHHRQH